MKLPTAAIGIIPTFFLFFLSISFSSCATTYPKNIDTNIEIVFLRHAVSLLSHNIREEYTIHMRNAAASESNHYIQHFDFILPKGRVEKLAYMTGYSEMLDPNEPDSY